MYKLKNSIAYDDDKYALEPQINDTSIVFSNSIDIYDGTEQFALEMCTCRCLQMFIATFFLRKHIKSTQPIIRCNPISCELGHRINMKKIPQNNSS